MMKWPFLLLVAQSLFWSGSQAARKNAYDISKEQSPLAPHFISKKGITYLKRDFSLGDPWHNGSFTIVFHGASSSGKSTLCCAMNDLHGQGKIGSKTNKGWTTEVSVYGRNYDPKTKSRCFMLDTPGFGESSPDMQEVVRRGVDSAMREIRQLRAGSAPLRRIYMVVDASKKRYPANLRGQLQLLSRAYGTNVMSTVRFVLSKCDRPEDMTDKKYFDTYVGTLRDLYHEIFGAELRHDRILFVSTMGDKACIGQLVDDICASPTDPELIPNGISIVDEFATAVKRVRDLEAAYMSDALRPLWEARHVDPKSLELYQRRVARLKGLVKDHEETIQERQGLLQFYEQRSQELREEYMPPCTATGADLFSVLKAIRELACGGVIADDMYNRLVQYVAAQDQNKIVDLALLVIPIVAALDPNMMVKPAVDRGRLKKFWSEVLEAYDQDDKYQRSIAALKRELAILKKNAPEIAAIAVNLQAEMDSIMANLPMKQKLAKSRKEELEPQLSDARTEVASLTAEVAPCC